jgi:RNase P/RNase MRP subunit p29
MWSYAGTSGILNQMWQITPIPNSNAFTIVSDDNRSALGIQGLLESVTNVVLVPIEKAPLTPWYIETDGTTFSFFLMDVFQVKYYLSFSATDNGSLVTVSSSPDQTKFIVTSTPSSPSSLPTIPSYEVYLCGTNDGTTCS